MREILNILFSHTTYGAPGGLRIEGPLIFVVTALGVIGGVFAATMIWVYKDAIKRDRNPVVAMIFILLTGWPVSFIWWLWLRPECKQESPESRTVLGSLPPVPSQS